MLPWFAALLDDARAAWRVKPSAGAKAAVMYALETASTALTPADEAHDEASVAAAVQRVACTWLACYVSGCRAAYWLCGPPTLDMATSRMLSTGVVHTSAQSLSCACLHRAGPQAAGPARRAVAGVAGLATEKVRAAVAAHSAAAAGPASARHAAGARS